MINVNMKSPKKIIYIAVHLFILYLLNGVSLKF